MKSLDTWIDRRGRAVLDESGKGFFVYDDGKGWMAIVEVYYNKSKEILMNRTHKVSLATLKKVNRTKNISRRITYKIDAKMSKKLRDAIKEISALALGEEYSESEEMKGVVKSEKDEELKDFLKKHSGI